MSQDDAPTHYSAIDDQVLGDIERDLHFHPCGVEHPQVLSPEQIETFNRDGYIAPLRVFDDDEIAHHRSYFDDLLAQVQAEGKDSYSISTAHMKYGRAFDLLVHPRIVEPICDLLGEDVIGWGSHYFCKMPGDGKTVSWHQDASYWPLTPSKTATAWLAIDDADTENACMRFIAGSHLHGHLPYRESDEAEDNVLDQTIEDVGQYGEPVDVVLRAGEVSIHTDLLLHGSRANTSLRRRCGLTLRYCTADVRASLGWSGKGVVVRGSDSSGHWGNPRRPDAD